MSHSSFGSALETVDTTIGPSRERRTTSLRMARSPSLSSLPPMMTSEPLGCRDCSARERPARRRARSTAAFGLGLALALLTATQHHLRLRLARRRRFGRRRRTVSGEHFPYRVAIVVEEDDLVARAHLGDCGLHRLSLVEHDVAGQPWILGGDRLAQQTGDLAARAAARVVVFPHDDPV